MNQFRKFRKNKKTTENNIRKVKSLTLKISLILLNFMVATFAWFSYYRSFEVGVDVNVSAWKIDFKQSNTSLGPSVEFTVTDVYPGMEDYVKEIAISNLGDKDAAISYEIQSLTILGNEYTIKDEVSNEDPEYTVYREVTTQNGITTVNLLNDSSKFPFDIVITHSEQLTRKSGDNSTGKFEIRLIWPYEIEGTEAEKTQKNLLDTSWGYQIANFYNSLPGNSESQAIEIQLTATAKQIITEENN